MDATAKSVVLLVNDSNNTGVKSLFDRLGCTVEAISSSEVIDVLADRRIDMIVLDIDSIGKKTVDLVRMIRRSDRSTPIITSAATYISHGYDIETDLRRTGVFVCRGKPLCEKEAKWLIESARTYSQNRSSHPVGR